MPGRHAQFNSHRCCTGMNETAHYCIPCSSLAIECIDKSELSVGGPATFYHRLENKALCTESAPSVGRHHSQKTLQNSRCPSCSPHPGSGNVRRTVPSCCLLSQGRSITSCCTEFSGLTCGQLTLLETNSAPWETETKYIRTRD